jgi:release factor glutamine methyltransferase
MQVDLTYIEALEPLVCVEVGSGSGCVINFLASLLGRKCAYFATDVNAAAARATRQTARHNGHAVEVVRTDLVAGLLERLAGKVDVLLFNPPYVVTPPEEVGSTGIAAAWAGGARGRMVTDRLLGHVGRLLSAKGALYMVAIAENDPADMARILARDGLKWTTVLERRAGRERLAIHRFSYT